MTSFTANRSYPYPDPTDPADMPSALQALAEAVDLDMSQLVATISVPPTVHVIASTPQSVPPGVTTKINFDTVVYNNDGIADLAVSPTDFTPPTAGVYLVSAEYRVPDNTSRYSGILSKDFVGYGNRIHQTDSIGQTRIVITGMNTFDGTEPTWVTLLHGASSSQLANTARFTMYRVAF